MYWQEKQTNTDKNVPDDIVDVIYSIRCRALPVDHAYALSQTITAALPWFADEDNTAIHTIHVAETSNGWIRPEGPDELLYLSKRTKFTLRVPTHRVEDAKALIGMSLQVAGNDLEITKASIRNLSALTTLFSRYIITEGTNDETEFLARCQQELASMNIKVKKMLCGMEKNINTPDGQIKARSLMLADLDFDETISLQRQGLGSHQLLGCGIFIPHKDINEISEDQG